MSTGGQLGSIGIATGANAPRARIMWLERDRWWNPMCANYLYAHPRNNRIGDFNASIAFYELVAGSCRLCLQPITLPDLYMRPGRPLLSNGVTGIDSGRALHKHINQSQPKDAVYVWTTANAAVTAEFSLTDVNPDLLSTYTATVRARVARCNNAGAIRTIGDAGSSLSVQVDLMQSGVSVASTTATVGIGFTTVEFSLTPLQYATVVDWASGVVVSSDLTLKLTTTASGGAAPADHSGMALSWAEVALILE